MTKVDVAALIALCAALASAVGDVIRQRSAQEITDEDVGHLELFRMSLRDKRWWLGGLAAIVNYSLQAAALAWGSVVLVTALQVTALLFALPIYARLTNYRVTRWEWVWAVVLAAALAVVIIVGDPQSGHERASLSTWMIVAAVMGPTLVLCVLGARIWKGRPVAAILLAVVAGSSLALFAVLTKGVVEVAERGPGAVLRMPEFVPWLLIALCGMVFQQSAFRAGALTASLPTMTVAKPVVAGVLGVTVLGETLRATGPAALALVSAVALVIIATVALARGEAASMAAGTGRDLKDDPLPSDPPPQESIPVSPAAPDPTKTIT
ncbi:DMT family transporter [Mycobacterium terramassiliense]|uniref:Permease of the drug/metabolite transporter (DMT) superfamily n=1 Tax=Mycobacterium terramassiliense TaxID=1841859 RepID=A0A2U3N858_9MYCO|nr:DMT family transporter [Mycobacterium terramassiliense]SPM27639.1 Permease of the drug/metabolite transporter (DMT) superfamily [Mycobacterium terramassiliense]